MEPERPKVDRAVLDFIKGHVFDPADFVIRTDGVCRLNPEMARMVVHRVSSREGATPEMTRLPKKEADGLVGANRYPLDNFGTDLLLQPGDGCV